MPDSNTAYEEEYQEQCLTQEEEDIKYEEGLAYAMQNMLTNLEELYEIADEDLCKFTMIDIAIISLDSEQEAGKLLKRYLKALVKQKAVKYANTQDYVITEDVDIMETAREEALGSIESVEGSI